MKELNLTLYEIFGYLLPGAITCLAIAIVFYRTAIPESAIYIPESSNTFAAILIGIAYLSGHISQAIGNLIFKKIHFSENAMLDSPNDGLSPVLISQIKMSLARIFSINIDDLDARLTYQLCDAFVSQNGKVVDKEIYQYREGFYRGLSVSCAFLSLACTLMFWHNPINVKWFSYCEFVLTNRIFIFVFFISIIGSSLFYRRYNRFCRYRIIHAITSFFVLSRGK